ncbi:MAG: hypothetical protein R3E96_11050 [Planctomycetota bacterium]
MFFRRKDNTPNDPDDRRRVLRRTPRNRDEFKVTLEPVQDGAMVGQLDGVVLLNLDSTLDKSLEGRLDDLCIQGANVRVSRDAGKFYLHVDQVIAACTSTPAKAGASLRLVWCVRSKRPRVST